MKKIIQLVTIILLVTGITSAVLIVYDHITTSTMTKNTGKPSIIDETHAQDIAIKTGQWSKENLDGKTITTNLLHVKNDGFAFYVDKKTLEDEQLYKHTKFQEFQEGTYLWQITISQGNKAGPEYLINAVNGSVLFSSDQRFSKIDMEMLGSYLPLTLRGHFLRGYMEPVSPQKDVSIFVNHVFMGTTSTDPNGCFQFTDWDDSKMQPIFKDLIESDKKKIEHTAPALRFTAADLGDKNHNPVNATKTSYLYLGRVPLAWSSYDASIWPSTIQLKKGSTVDFELTVRPNHKEAETEHMVLDIRRLPCGVSWALTTLSGDVDSDKVTLDHPGTFHLILGAADYARPGRYFVDIQQDG